VKVVLVIATALLLATSAGAVPPYSQLAKLYGYNASAPLDVGEAGVTTEEGIAVHDLSYASPVRGRVPAYLVLPAGTGPFPVVLYAPGSNGTRDDFLGDARLLAKRGLAGFLFTPPHNRPGGPLLTTCNWAKDVATIAQYVKEERRALDVIAQRPELDAKRIGYVGFSLGADFGGILAGVEKRITTYVLQSGRGHFTVFPVSDCALQLRAKQLARYRQQIGIVNAVHYVGHAAPASLLIQNGRLDAISPRKDVLALYNAASRPKTLRWYSSTHQLPVAATAFRDSWLLSHLR
jgi:cephalosporin-C deacetylase-like acetyl esterase